MTQRLSEQLFKVPTYEAEIYERAEHWTFTVRVRAFSEDAARKTLRAEYPPKKYAIRDLRRDNSKAEGR